MLSKRLSVITGSNGFLMNALLASGLPLEGYCYHFGCPIDGFTEDNVQKLREHIKDTHEILAVARKFDLKLVYASSMEVVSPTEDCVYNEVKYAVEQMLDVSKDIIWRVPRVYSYSRPNGLMRVLRDTPEKIEDPNKEIEFVLLDDFVRSFKASLDTPGIKYYQGNTHTRKIKDIMSFLYSKEAKCSL